MNDEELKMKAFHSVYGNGEVKPVEMDLIYNYRVRGNGFKRGKLISTPITVGTYVTVLHVVNEDGVLEEFKRGYIVDIFPKHDVINLNKAKFYYGDNYKAFMKPMKKDRFVILSTFDKQFYTFIHGIDGQSLVKEIDENED